MAGSVIWTLVAGFITLAILSFLFRDNPLYKLAEHVAVGVSVGYLIVVQFNNVFIPKVWITILHEGKFDYLIPLILGILLFSRFVPKYVWMSRWSLAFLLGAGSGLSIPATLEARVLQQMDGSMRPLLSIVSGHPWQSVAATFSAIFLVVGTLACLVFFLFSVEHKGGIGRLAYFGRLCIMAGFGASFGFTVMARVSLLIGRVQFLTRDFVQAIQHLF